MLFRPARRPAFCTASRFQRWALPLLAFLLLGISQAWQPEGEDPYELLGVERGGDLSAAALKKAYRRAALKWHPDKVAEDRKAEAEQKFIAVAWAYEVLGDPSKRAAFEQPGSRTGADSGAGGAGGAGPGGDWARSGGFSFEEAVKIFERAFGKKSGEFRDLIEHFAKHAAVGGDAEGFRAHAMKILQAVSKGDGKNFEVETKSKSGRMKTKQTVSDDGRGTQTKTTKTESTVTHTSGGPAALGHGHPAGHLGHGHDAHMAAHQAAMAAHEKAMKQAQLGGGSHRHLPEL